MRWLGVASKKTPGRRDFQGGIAFSPFNPPRHAENIGKSRATYELGQSLVGLKALMAGFRDSHYPSTAKSHPWRAMKAGFHTALQKATERHTMGLTGDYAGPHILRKMLLLNGDLPALTVPEMVELMPDEQGALDKITDSLRDRGRLSSALMCPDMFITCHNCNSLSFPAS